MELLESLGADVVVTPALLGSTEEYARAVAGLPRPRLGLNCVGGSIATSVSAPEPAVPTLGQQRFSKFVLCRVSRPSK